MLPAVVTQTTRFCPNGGAWQPVISPAAFLRHRHFPANSVGGGHGATSLPFCPELLEERARRAQAKSHVSVERSLDLLRRAAIEQRCVTYGDLAKARNVGWSQARHTMSGANGHLDRLPDICHARGLPMLPALCVNQSGLQTGELEESALSGFVTGARRVGFAVTDGLSYHHKCRDECREWGRTEP